MVRKDLLVNLSVSALKTAIVLVMLVIVSRFIESLPFGGVMVFNKAITAADLIAAFISIAAIVVFIRAGLDAKPAVDELADWLPGAGTLLNYIMGIAALLYAYAAFMPVALPFLREFEWVYQSVFLACTLFLLAKAALLVYNASESVSRFLVSAAERLKELYCGAKPEKK